MSDIGHNGGPKIQKFTSKHKVERIKEVLDMDISAAQKCIGIRIIADADADGITPELSTDDLKRSASVKDRVTVYRATQKLDEKKVAKAVKEDGRPNRYFVLPSKSIDSALDEIDATSGVGPPPHTAIKPHCDQTAPVGSNPTTPVLLNPTTPVRPNPTSAVEPDGLDRTGTVEPHCPSPDPSRAHANIENLTGLLFPEEVEEKNKIPNQPEPPKRAKPRAKPTAAQFDRFWNAYPKREGKQKAYERFMALTPEDAEKAVYGAEQFAAQCRQKGTDPKYIKWPEGWINAKRFLDYSEATQQQPAVVERPASNWWKANPAAARKFATPAWWRGLIKAFANGHWPTETLGPPPGDIECLVPGALIDELRLTEIYDEHGDRRS
jgi:hypothetical protein